MSLYEIRAMAIEIAGKRLVNNVDITVEAGQCTAIIGASGSGKSLSCLSPFGLTPAKVFGSVILDGIDIIQADAHQARKARSRLTGFIFQQPLTALTPHLTIGAQLQEAAAQAGPPRLSRRELAQKLERVGLARADERLDQYPHRLSGGERQRVMIAAAIAHRPKLLIADEPTSALDTSLRAEIMALLDELRTEQGLGLLLVSHDLASVKDHADHIIVMENGEVVEQGLAADITGRPAKDYTRRLIAATPRLDDPAPQLPDVGECVLEVMEASIRFPRAGWRRGTIDAVKNVSLSVYEGETLAVVGGSGSGKSTLGRAIAGIGPLTSGEIYWHGKTMPERRKRSLAMRALTQPVFQDPVASLDPRWAVRNIVTEPLVNLHPQIDKAERERLMLAALVDVGLDESFTDRLPTSLSGGQAQRVAIARALVAEPKLLVLDEATSALDPLVGAAILELLARLQHHRRVAIILITHDIASARRLAHRVMVLHEGEVVEEGMTEQIILNPVHSVTRKLIAAST